MRGLITKYYFLEVEIKENGMCGLCAVAVLVMMCSIRLHGLPTHLAARAKLQGSIQSNLTYRSFNMQRSEELVTTTRMWPSDSCPFLPNSRQNSTRVFPNPSGLHIMLLLLLLLLLLVPVCLTARPFRPLSCRGSQRANPPTGMAAVRPRCPLPENPTATSATANSPRICFAIDGGKIMTKHRKKLTWRPSSRTPYS